jgi:hypothetical protein
MLTLWLASIGFIVRTPSALQCGCFDMKAFDAKLKKIAKARLKSGAAK